MKRLLSTILLSIVITSPVIAAQIDTYIPTKAYGLMPLVAEESARYATPFDLAFMFALMEGESCVSLKHSRCFSTTSNYKTRWRNGKRREEGAGLLQFTRTWHRSGKVRFDTLTRIAKKYRTHLKGLGWHNIYSNKRLQIRAGIFLTLDTWNGLPSTVPPCEKLPMAMSAHNQGAGGLRQDRRLCGMTKGCNPNKWFGNVEKVKRWGFSTNRLAHGRTAWATNRKHVGLVMKKRRPKYTRYFNSLISKK